MPGESFKSDMIRYAGETRSECEYIASELDHPDYAILSEAQLDYYFYWRGELAGGRLPVNDEGYMWLRMCEIVNMCEDPAQGLRELRLMFDRGGYRRMRDTVISTLVDWCIVHSLPIPPIWIWGWDDRRSIILTSVMSPCPDRMPLEFIRREGQVDNIYYDDENELADACNAIIQLLDRHLVMRTGKGILETYSRRTATLHSVFEGLVTFEELPTYRISYLRPAPEFNTVMRSVIRFAEKCLFKVKGYNGPNCPGAFTAEYRRVAAEAVEDMRKGAVVFLPKSELLYFTMEVSRREKMLIEVGETMADADEGRILEDIAAVQMPIKAKFERDLKRLRKMTPPDPMLYIPSGAFNLAPDLAGKEQLDYYLFWRDETKKGTFHDTDMGYVWLYLCELINSDEPREKVLEYLSGLSKAYEDEDMSRPLIGITYLDYALASGILNPDPSVFRSQIAMNLAIDSVFGDSSPSLDIETVSVAADLKIGTAMRDFDDDCLRALMLALRLLDKERPMHTRCNLRSMMLIGRPFKRLRYYGKLPKEISMEYLGYLENDAFCSGMRDLVRCTIQTMARVRGGKGKVRVDRAFGESVGNLVERCARMAVNSPSATTRRRIEIDSDLVDRAEEELRTVTDLMGVECEEDGPQTVQVRTREVSQGDPWSAFRSALTPEEAGFIGSLLSGTRVAENVRIVDSINGKAMDTIGDIVVENGEIIEDYLEDLQEMMG